MGARDLDRQIRTIRGRSEQVLDVDLNITDPIVPWVVRHASWLVYRHRVKLDGHSPYRAIKGRPHGGEAVELGEQVHWKVPRLTLQKFEDRWRPWVGKAERMDENLITDVDDVDTSIQRRHPQHRWNWQKVREVNTTWGRVTALLEDTRMRADRGSHALGGTNQGNDRGGGRCEASQIECNDKGDLIGSSSSKWIIVEFECTSHQASSSDSRTAAETAISSSSAYAVSSKQNCIVDCP